MKRYNLIFFICLFALQNSECRLVTKQEWLNAEADEINALNNIRLASIYCLIPLLKNIFKGDAKLQQKMVDFIINKIVKLYNISISTDIQQAEDMKGYIKQVLNLSDASIKKSLGTKDDTIAQFAAQILESIINNVITIETTGHSRLGAMKRNTKIFLGQICKTFGDNCPSEILDDLDNLEKSTANN